MQIKFAKRLLGWLLPVIVCAHTTAAEAPLALTWTRFTPLPDRLGLAGAFAGVSHGELLVAGGANFPGKLPWEGGKKSWHDTVYALARTNAAWRVVGQLPRPLAYGVSLTVPGGVLCVGGADGQQHYAEVSLLALTPTHLRVTALPSLPLALASGAGALVGSVACVACGADRPGEPAGLNRLFSLDLTVPEPAWRELAPCPGEPRILPVAAAADGVFYLAGGAALRSLDGQVRRVYLHDCWRFTREQKWERLADLPTACVAAPTPAPIIHGRMLLVGGDDGSRVDFQPLDQHPGFPATIRALDLVPGRWTTLPGPPAPRATLAAVEWNGWFVFPSGEVRPGVRSPEVWACR